MPNLLCELCTRHQGKAHIGEQEINIIWMSAEHYERLLVCCRADLSGFL